MATHQEIAQVSDEELLARMVRSHDGRFDEQFWNYFDEQVAPMLPDQPVIADLGCGPGLFLRDLARRIPAASLIGLDVTPAMIEYARAVEYPGEAPTFHLCDLTTGPLPLADSSIDLLGMVAVYHVLNDPLEVAKELRRVLSADGIFLLQDWIRSPLVDYLDRMLTDVPDNIVDAARKSMLRLFPTHNKYTVDDWLWLLAEGGFDVIDYGEVNSPHFRTFVCRPA